MSAVIESLMDAIVTELNTGGGTFNQAFTAVKQLMPAYDEPSGVEVTIRQGTTVREKVSRGRSYRKIYMVYVVVRAPIDEGEPGADANAEIGDMLELTEQIATHITEQPATLAGLVCLGSSDEVPPDEDLLEGCFYYSLTAFTFSA